MTEDICPSFSSNQDLGRDFSKFSKIAPSWLIFCFSVFTFNKILENCDLCLVIGTSSVVYPAAMFAPQVASRGVPVAEFNIESTQHTLDFGYYFEGIKVECFCIYKNSF